MSANAGLNVISGVEVTERIQVFLATSDSVLRDGVASQLRGHDVEIVDERLLGGGVLAVVVVDELDEAATREMRALRRRGVDRLVLVATRVDDVTLLAAIELGASGVLRRSESTPINLLRTIRAAAGGKVLNPRGLTFSGLTERELKVLRLLADGLDTAEGGRHLFLSERTVSSDETPLVAARVAVQGVGGLCSGQGTIRKKDSYWARAESAGTGTAAIRGRHAFDAGPADGRRPWDE